MPVWKNRKEGIGRKTDLRYNQSMLISSWFDLLEKHKKNFPVASPRDLYKLLYQGMRGPEHLIDDETSFKQYLEDELKGLLPEPNQPLLEPIRPDGRLCRIHLRAWLSTGKNLDELVQECLKAARNPWNTHQELIETWQGFAQMTDLDTSSFNMWLQAKDYPPVHHSEEYIEEYQPAYRLVMN
jgi:hypothetical protein